jgi:predicted RNA binding protein YcfA (HicA-like mRNA interferase family)
VSRAQRKRLLDRIRQKRCKNVRFEDLVRLLEAYGCTHERTRGSHHIYVYPRLRRPIVLQRPHQSDVPSPFCRQILDVIDEIIELEEEETESENNNA